MNTSTRILGVLLSIIALAGCSKSEDKSAGAGATQPAGQAGSLRIAVIPKGTTHAYWKTVDAGAQQAAKELGVDMVWKGPVKEDDRGDQIAVVQQFVAQGINGIVLAPLDFEGLADPVQDAASKGIPVVIIDSAVKGTVGKDFASFVSTDNHQAGVLGGQTLAKLLNGKGKVVLLRYSPGSESTEQREAGFLEAVAKFPDISVISSDQYAGATQAEAQNKAMNMSARLGEADGIFCPNESATMGMLLALDQLQMGGKKKFVGFDATPELTDALKAKKLDALVAQDPRKMGYMGVQTLVSVLKKQPVQTRVDTGAVVVTLDNLAQPDIQKVLGE